ncbi:MAG: malto-oligosyltrehalose synthase, partial [Ignavibacteria bacterium]
FQQLTGPLMAKGFEDTTLYIYNRFVSLNEVGGNPGKFGIPLNKFHEFNMYRNKHWPHSMCASSTHDTKRGEDIRARLNVLSEIPDEWNSKIKLWSRFNKKFKSNFNSDLVPGSNEEYLIYQMLLGSFPFSESDLGDYKNRFKEYLVKAVREAKVHSTWSRPQKEYEDASVSFLENILARSDDNIFMKDFSGFQRKISHYGILNSLSQTLLKITSPGVPDFYQGRELWDFSFVDPDNRSRVDYKIRKEILEDINRKDKSGTRELIDELLKKPESGGVKMYLIYKALRSRNENIELFRKGEYIPLKSGGNYQKNIIAFARKLENKYSITAVPRFLTGIIKENEFPLGNECWKDTKIIIPFEARSFCNTITGEEIESKDGISIGDLFKSFPAAMLLNN